MDTTCFCEEHTPSRTVDYGAANSAPKQARSENAMSRLTQVPHINTEIEFNVCVLTQVIISCHFTASKHRGTQKGAG